MTKKEREKKKIVYLLPFLNRVCKKPTCNGRILEKIYPSHQKEGKRALRKGRGWKNGVVE